MLIVHPFVYGRTRTIDYRWLQKPAHPLRGTFFATALELGASELREGRRYYFAGIHETACALCLMLAPKNAKDEKGRAIRFALGYSVGARQAREFSYYLPDLLERCPPLFHRYFDPVLAAVATDHAVAIPKVAPQMLSPAPDEWLQTTAASIRTRIDTPRIVSNFDTAELGQFLQISSSQSDQTARKADRKKSWQSRFLSLLHPPTND